MGPTGIFKQRLISIHALYAEGDYNASATQYSSLISIHALYAEGDSVGSVLVTCVANFNPRPLCRGRRMLITACLLANQFQSTPSMQRATPNTRWSYANVWISIHALYAEGDWSSSFYPQ